MIRFSVSAGPRLTSRAVVRIIALVCALLGALGGSPAAGDAVPIAPGSWTLAILPDTQIYAQSFPQHYTAQTQWIRDHVASHNIKYVLHEGDITNNNNVPQWNNALASMNVLNGHIPYAMAPGNHDYGNNGSSDNRISFFNQANYFGPGTFYANQPSIGGFFEAGKTDNTYHTFNADGEDWLVLALEWGPRDEVVAWANQIVENHPNHAAMLVTHAYMYYDETIYDWATKGPSQSWNPHSYPFVGNGTAGTVNDGQQLWDKLVKMHENFEFVFNGHVLSDGTGYRSTLGDEGNVVHQMLANYQMKQQGGMGDMRLLEFKTDGTVEVRTYSPVLDRHDTTYDQQFTLKRGELHGPLLPPPPPLIPHVAAANLIAVGETDPVSNIVDAVQIPQSSAPGVTTGQLNRGDYQVRVGGRLLTYQEGILLASITQHDRPDFVNRRATVEAGRDPYGDGFVSLSIMEAGNPADNEVNFNTSVAWFQFRAGWQGAHVNGNGTLAVGASNRVDQSMVTRTGMGRYRVNLGVDSRNDGLLFAIANNNDNIVAQTAPFTDGSGWDVRIEDNATNHAATGEDREWSFLYLPYETDGLIGGLYDGASNTHISSAGSFTMNRLSVGQYELTVPDETPQTGMLLLTVAHLATSTVTAPDDNILTYQASPSGSFLINSYDLPALNLQDTRFAWAFIGFDNPIQPFFMAGDYNRDGLVNASDHVLWRSQFGMSGTSLAADGNRDGKVDVADYVLWRKNAAGASAAGAGAVPEPTSLWFALVMSLLFAVRRH